MQPRLLTKLRVLSLIASAPALACSGDPEAGFGVERAAIVYGEPSDETDDEVVYVVSQISETDTLGCTGTLIAPDILLTALHCVAFRRDPEATFSCRPDGTIVPNSPGAGSFGEPIAGENVQVFRGPVQGAEPDARGVKVFGSGATQICRGDLAVVVLDTEVGQDIAPIRFGKSVTRGESLMLLGYGVTEMVGSQGRRRREASVVDVGDVGCVQGTGPTPPDTFVVTEGPCHGDSGGPALSEETGAVTGVYSLTLAPSCTSLGARNTYTLVAPFEDTIREAFEFAGREPLLEPNSGGSAGMSNCSGTGGTDGTEEGSGSREDPSCACRSANVRTPAYGWLALAMTALAAARRRARSRR